MSVSAIEYTSYQLRFSTDISLVSENLFELRRGRAGPRGRLAEVLAAARNVGTNPKESYEEDFYGACAA